MLIDRPPIRTGSRPGPVTRAIRLAILAGLALVMTAPVLAQDGERDRRRDRRREWNPTEHLQEIDRDKNGYLDSSELRGRMQEYVAGLGFNVSRPVSIQKIVAKYNADVEAKADAEKEKQRDASRTVAKFGTSETVTPVPDFSSTAAGAQAQQGRLEDLYDEDIVNMVRSYMKRFDENQDGWLETSESRRMIRVIGDDADTDGNDKLGELEIAAALQKRRESGSRRESGNRRESGGRRGGPGRPSPERPATSGTRKSAAAAAANTAAVTTTRTSRSLVGRQSSYVDGIFRKYDKDKNGSLSKAERKDMSSSVSGRFVDSDDNGEISRDEATASLLGKVKPASSPPSSDSDSKRERDSKSAARPSRRGSSDPEVKYDLKGFQRVPIPSQTRTDAETDLNRKGASGDFLDLDSNTDGQITMAEFRNGAKWTDELAEKFYDLDDNNDGVITIEEFNSGR